MRKLNKSTMLEKQCVYCKYYYKWQCKLEECYMEVEEKEKNNSLQENEDTKENIEINIERNIGIMEEEKNEESCEGCSYKIPRGCIGYCMKILLKECKEVWDKNRK